MSVVAVGRRLLALALVLLAVPLAAQSGTISGRITDSTSGAPVFGASVVAINASGGIAGSARSGADGQFRIMNLGTGSFTVQILSIGHVPHNALNIAAGATLNVALGKANMLEQVVVTTTRGAAAEKVLDAPASVSVVDEAAIARRPALTTTDHLKSSPGVDVSQGGIIQSNVVARGFNNIFSGSLLSLQDYRFAGVPSLRVNVPYLNTGTSDDIERIEVLLGPASALYGPNAANGVLHVITKSPFTSQGTTLTIDGGTQSIFRAAFRHAAVVGEKVGVKFSGEYMRGVDFKYTDPSEPSTYPSAAPAGRAGQPSVRDFDVERYTMEGRLDWRPGKTEAVTTLGFTDAVSGIELTGANGAGQVRDWTYMNLQERVRRGRFFAQAFINSTNAGNKDSLDLKGTYLIRSGQPIVDESRVMAAQVQHGYDLGSTKLTYGADYIFTNPRTGHTINGRNEDIDNVTEWGVYAQATTPLTKTLDLVSALRLDNHSEIDGYQVSPRASLVYRPNDNHSLRFSYNRAFSTPANFEYFLDLIQRRNVDGAGLDIRAVGNHGGRDFDRSCTGAAFGSFCMRSVYNGGASTAASASAAYAGFINARAALIQAGLQAKLAANPATAANAAALAAAIVNGLKNGAPTNADLATHVACLLPGCALLSPDGVKDIGALKASFNNSLEAGYKGLIGKKGRVSLDVWFQQRGDVSPPAGVATPNVFTDSASLATYFNTNMIATLTPVFQSFGMPQAQAQANAAGVAALAAPGLAGQLKSAPLGTITFDDETRSDVLFTYFSLDKKVNVFGIDLGYDWQLTNAFSLAGTYSWQNKNVFDEIVFAENTGANGLPYMSNSPKNKASLSLRYDNVKHNFGVDVRGRYTDAFPVNSGVYYSGKRIDDPNNPDPTVTLAPLPGVPVIAVMDAGVQWHLPVSGQDLTWALNGTNIFDNRRATFVGTPEIGRMILTRLQYKF